MYSWLRSIIFVLVVLLVLGLSGRAFGNTSLKVGSTGYDVSWPNCQATPPKHPAFGIIGVTGGKNYTVNTCANLEANWFKSYEAYMNTGNVEYDNGHRSLTYPRKCALQDAGCIAYNYGYGAAVYALKAASLADIHSPMWWLDVETENTWSDNAMSNRQAILGMRDAVVKATIFSNVGVYSYPGQWNLITNNWRSEFPAWAATGSLKRETAIKACADPYYQFTGTKPQLTQYTEVLDRNYVCP